MYQDFASISNKTFSGLVRSTRSTSGKPIGDLRNSYAPSGLSSSESQVVARTRLSISGMRSSTIPLTSAAAFAMSIRSPGSGSCTSSMTVPSSARTASLIRDASIDPKATDALTAVKTALRAAE